MNFFDKNKVNWNALQIIPNVSYECGFCGLHISSDRGYKIGLHGDGSGTQLGGIYICSNCNGPTFFDLDKIGHPSSSFGNTVDHLPETLGLLYNEARRCTSHNSYTAAVLLCRKMLMNMAVIKEQMRG